MGVYLTVTNETRKHQLNSEWKWRGPTDEYIQKIGAALDWDFSSDIILITADNESWNIWKDGTFKRGGEYPYEMPPIPTKFVELDYEKPFQRFRFKYLIINDIWLNEDLDKGVDVKAQFQNYVLPAFGEPVEEKQEPVTTCYDFIDDAC
jgi:hypothetical protein